MADHENHNNNTDDRGPLARHLWLGAIETLINTFIDLDPATHDRVAELDGLVVRVKILDPYLPFYLLFTREGIEVSDVSPTPARVRVNARLFDLMRTLLGTSPINASGRPRVRVWGESESVAVLESLLNDFNLRTRAQQWTHDHLNLDIFWQKIRNHDPSWLQDLLPLPGMMRETIKELRLINEQLNVQRTTFENYRLSNNKERRRDLLLILVVFICISTALNTNFSLAMLAGLNIERLVLLLMGALLIFFRLRH